MGASCIDTPHELPTPTAPSSGAAAAVSTSSGSSFGAGGSEVDPHAAQFSLHRTRALAEYQPELLHWDAHGDSDEIPGSITRNNDAAFSVNRPRHPRPKSQWFF